MFTTIVLLCALSSPCDQAHATSVIRAPCSSEIACLKEAQERLAQTALGRDMRGMTVKVVVERVKRRLEVSK